MKIRAITAIITGAIATVVTFLFWQKQTQSQETYGEVKIKATPYEHLHAGENIL